uniref:Uncharacterized protein n=1 Tax=Nothoprocta perdicaria TaxID=30464 RepID=A0A8C6YYX3_NOTPE
VLAGPPEFTCVCLVFVPFLADLLEGFKSPDPAVQEKALAETEERLREHEGSPEEGCWTKANRTAVNTGAPVRPNKCDFFFECVCLVALKEKGNDAFRRGDYVAAIQKYTEGLEKLKDKQQLYTNRAQVSTGKQT